MSELNKILRAERLAAAAAVYRDRRERIATAAMAGMLADSSRRVLPKDHAKVAVQYADALIAELDKPKEVQP